MLHPEEIKELLKDRTLKVVANRTGVSYINLLRFLQGKTANPSFNMIAKLSDYLEEKT
jgi:transcriptional regulator with XRE-family HTH domain